jgi:hypothetical protein
MDKFANFRDYFLELRAHEIASCDRDVNSLKSSKRRQTRRRIKMLIVTSIVCSFREAFRPQRVD